jgi:hypothetical protein
VGERAARGKLKMTTRLKVVCNTKNQFGEQENLVLTPVVNGSEENKRFFQYTPGGLVQFYTINKEAAAQFTVGKEYYVDISPAGE